MKQRTALQIILVISLLGIFFSGYLSYLELFGGCVGTVISCSAKENNLFGLPVCVYGFIMYLVVFIVAILGLRSRYIDVRKI